MRGPAIIGADARLTDCYIGPYTAIGERCEITASEVEHSILLAGCTVSRPRRAHGVLAARAQRERAPRRRASRARTASWSGTTPTSRSCEAARHRRRRHARPRRAARRRARRTRARAGRPAARSTSPTPPAVDALLDRVSSEPGSLDAVVNCAAWTDVDGAESKRELAHAVNADGAGNLARAAPRASACRCCTSPPTTCSTATAPLDARGEPRPYVESDPTGPRSVYGSTKLDGRAPGAGGLAAPHGRAHGVAVRRRRHELRRDDAAPGGRARRRAGRHRPDRLADVVGAPRAGAARAARAQRRRPRAPDRRRRGLVERLRAGDLPPGRGRLPVEPASSEQMARPAPRPAWSALASERDDVLPMPDWRDGLAGYLAARLG